jgi:hypothetical protein
MDYVTIDEIEVLFRELSDDEKNRASALIPIVCSELRLRAKKIGKDLDKIVEDDKDMLMVAKSVVCDVVARTLMTSTNQEPLSQASESAMGYSWSGTYLVPGGGLFIKRSELSRLGLNVHRLSGIEMCPHD